MRFVVTLTHPPELCLARGEFGDDFRQWLDGTTESQKRLGITVHGAYVCPNEHTFYFIVEAGDFQALTAILSGIMLTNNTGRISPVISLQEAADIVMR